MKNIIKLSLLALAFGGVSLNAAKKPYYKTRKAYRQRAAKRAAKEAARLAELEADAQKYIMAPGATDDVMVAYAQEQGSAAMKNETARKASQLFLKRVKIGTVVTAGVVTTTALAVLAAKNPEAVKRVAEFGKVKATQYENFARNKAKQAWNWTTKQAESFSGYFKAQAVALALAYQGQ